MNKKRDLIINTIIIFMGRASTQVISLLMLPLYTSYVITSEYGTVDLINTYVSLLVPVLSLELDMAVFRFLIDKRDKEEEKKKIISTTVYAMILIMILTIIVFCFINYFITLKYSIYILMCIIFNMLSLILTQICRGLGKNIDYSIACTIGGIVTIGMNIFLLIPLHMGGRGMLISLIISYIAMSVYLIMRTNCFKYISKNCFDKKILKELIKYSVPLIPNLISWWIVSVSDRTIISIFLGTSLTGIYSVANKFPTLFSGIYNVFHLSWSEQASLHYKDADRQKYFSSVINNGIRIFGSICLLIISFLPIVYKLLINNDYLDSYNQVPILMVAIMFNVVIGLISVIYIAEKKSNELAKTSIIASIINILFNVCFINRLGLYAASISTFIAYFTMLIFRIIDTRKYIKIEYSTKMLVVLIISYIIVCNSYYLNNIYLNYLTFIGTILISLYINKDNIKELIFFIKKKVSRK